jgi:multiple sugar transport system permease protein
MDTTTAVRKSEARPRRLRLGHDWAWFSVFLIPAILVVVVVQFYPLAYSAFLSTQDWSLTRSQHPLGFVGVTNFTKILADPVFKRAVLNSAFITGFAVTVELLLGTTLAFLTTGSSWLIRSVRTLLILPMVIAPVAAGTLWRMVLNTQAGLASFLPLLIGQPGPEWLGSPEWARIAVTMLDIWQFTPFVLLVVAAGITGIPGELLESAAIDGASRWQTLWRVQLPLLTPVLLLTVMFRVLDSLLSLDAVYSLTLGGPGYATYTMTFFIYSLGLKTFNLGFAAAASWLFMAFTTVVIVLMFWLHRRSAMG